MINILALYLDFECAKNIHSFKMLKVPDWSLASWSWLGYGHCFLVDRCSQFWLSIWILKVQRTSMFFKSSFWSLKDAGGSLLMFDTLILIWIWSLIFDTFISWIFSLSWFWWFKDHSYPLIPDLWLWRMLEVPDWGLASWSLFGYGHWSLIHTWSKFLLSIFILKVQRASVFYGLIWGFRKCWRFLTEVWHLDLE